MIQYVTGLPGSGKSYYGVFNIAIHFAKSLKDNSKFKSFALEESSYKVCLTNLNELKLSEFENVKSFVFEDFLKILTELYSMYKNGATDSELEYIVENEDFLYSLIVVDECHNYLQKDNEVVVWWLTYHRHFHQDILMITQDLALVNKKYKACTEYFYKAMPQSRKLFRNYNIYQQYVSYQMFKTQKAQTKKLPIIQDIFKLYGSGANQKTKSLIVYYLLFSLFIFIVFLILGYFLIYHMGSSETKSDTSKNSINSQTQQSLKPQNNSFAHNIQMVENDIPNYQIFQMKCNLKTCLINGKLYSKKFLDDLFRKEYKTKIISIDKSVIYILIDDKYGIFKIDNSIDTKGQNNEMADIFDIFHNQTK
ncbi:MAG: zonular occludens toxin domain-containing protein [Arcobacteraceae bacterium]